MKCEDEDDLTPEQEAELATALEQVNQVVPTLNARLDQITVQAEAIRSDLRRLKELTADTERRIARIETMIEITGRSVPRTKQ